MSTQPPYDSATIREFLDAPYESEEWYPFHNLMVEGPAAMAWDQVKLAIASAKSDDELIRIGVAFMEPLLQTHGEAIIDVVAADARADKRVRRALSAVMSGDLPPRISSVLQTLTADS